EPASPPSATPPTLFREPEEGRAPLISVIEQAQEDIRLTLYLFTDETMADALTRAARRGVQVRLLLEHRPYGGGAANERMAKRLSKAGIHVRWSNPAFRYTHQKSLVVDGTTGVIMTLNWTHSSFSRNREYGVIFQRRDWVEEMAAVFDGDWDRKPTHVGTSGLVWSPDNARERILGLIQQARSSLILEEQDLRDPEVVQALLAAVRRGVDVQIIRPTPREEDTLEWENVRHLARAGAHIFFLDAPYVHAKVMVVDRSRALIGSMNLTPTSLDFNRELGAIFREESVLRPLLRTLEQDRTRAAPYSPAKKSARGILTPEEAARHVGEIVTVEGRIVQTYDTGHLTFLDFTHRKEDLSIVIFAKDYSRFPAPPARYYHNRRVRVRGRVQLHKGAPEIVVHSPDEIQIVSDE
ncbi:MAG: DNA-binding protein, partial [Chloroflexi bacterium]|nr:DNA-binding protein [Chloroflexota bacterium]